jgi:hypothetical protein
MPEATKSKKAQEQEAEKAAATERKAKEQAEKQAAKEAKAKEREAKKQAAEKDRAAKKEAKAHAALEARQALVESGDLIENDGTEFHRVTREDTPTVESRAVAVIAALQAKGRTVPVSGKALQDEFDGGWPQYLSFFAMLKSLGLVREYRSRTGERGGSGVAYLWIGE